MFRVSYLGDYKLVSEGPSSGQLSWPVACISICDFGDRDMSIIKILTNPKWNMRATISRSCESYVARIESIPEGTARRNPSVPPTDHCFRSPQAAEKYARVILGLPSSG
jgi:hypothetical protein